MFIVVQGIREEGRVRVGHFWGRGWAVRRFYINFLIFKFLYEGYGEKAIK